MRVGYEQAATILGVKPGTLRSMVNRKQVPHIRLSARLVVFDVAALEAHLAEHTITPSSAARPELRVVEGGSR